MEQQHTALTLAIPRQTELTTSIHQICVELREELPAMTSTQDKVAGLVAAFRVAKTELRDLKIVLAQQLTILQNQLQPDITPEVCEQCTTLVTKAMDTIIAQIV